MRIIYLDLDTLRPDHLGCYGYHRNTSPNIDSIAAQGVRFTNYYCSDAPCQPSRTALVTGKFGVHSGVVSHGGTAADLRLEGEKRGFRSMLDKENLTGMLRSSGFRTILISPFAERHSAWYFYAGFNEVHNTGKYGMESAEEISTVAMEWLERNAEKENWFLHVNFWDAHVPFRTPSSFGNPFAGEPLPSWLTEEALVAQKRMVGIQRIHEKQNAFKRYADGMRHGIGLDLPPLPRNPRAIETIDDVRSIIDGYDCGIRHMDDHIGKIFHLLSSRGVMEETAVIISSDHGENLGELGIYGDHITADQATMRIPMIIKWPGCMKGFIDDGLHYNLDLLPTLAELLNKRNSPSWDGATYAPTVMKGQNHGRNELVLGQCAGTCQRSVRYDKWLYIKTYHDGYNIIPDEMLFDVVKDPHEVNDVASCNKDVCAEAAIRLARWQERMMKTMPNGYSDDPLEIVIKEGGPSHVRGSLPRYLKRLEDAGLINDADELRRRHPLEF